jgi:hypothetical protein
MGLHMILPLMFNATVAIACLCQLAEGQNRPAWKYRHGSCYGHIYHDDGNKWIVIGPACGPGSSSALVMETAPLIGNPKVILLVEKDGRDDAKRYIYIKDTIAYAATVLPEEIKQGWVDWEVFGVGTWETKIKSSDLGRTGSGFGNVVVTQTGDLVIDWESGTEDPNSSRSERLTADMQGRFLEQEQRLKEKQSANAAEQSAAKEAGRQRAQASSETAGRREREIYKWVSETLALQADRVRLARGTASQLAQGRAEDYSLQIVNREKQTRCNWFVADYVVGVTGRRLAEIHDKDGNPFLAAPMFDNLSASSSRQGTGWHRASQVHPTDGWNGTFRNAQRASDHGLLVIAAYKTGSTGHVGIVVPAPDEELTMSGSWAKYLNLKNGESPVVPHIAQAGTTVSHHTSFAVAFGTPSVLPVATNPDLIQFFVYAPGANLEMLGRLLRH